MTVKAFQHTLAKASGGLPPLVIDRWGYEASGPGIAEVGPTSPGPTLVATSGKPVHVTWVNDLPWHTGDKGERLPPHYPFRMAEEPVAAMMMTPRYFCGHTVAHLHGGHVPWTSDGHPMRLPKTETKDYANPTGHVALRAPGDQEVKMVYPNSQPAATLWYHDHAMDSTVANVYAGLAGGYVLRHPGEATAASPVLNTPGIPLVIQDISLVTDPLDDRIKPYYGQITTLDDYLNQRDMLGPTNRATLSGSLNNNAPAPEFKGSAMMVNTALWPTHNVPQRAMRFRVVNGCTGRMLVMRLSKKALPSPPNPWDEAGSLLAGDALPLLWQIGSDGGFLTKPVSLSGTPGGGFPLNDPKDTQNFLILAPGERADIVIDFSGLQPGDLVFLTNHAVDPPSPQPLFPGYSYSNAAPFGNGGDRADQAWPSNTSQKMGLDQIIRFNVIADATGLVPFNVGTLATDLAHLHEVPTHPVIKNPGAPTYTPDRALVISEFDSYATSQEIAITPHLSRPPWNGIGFLDRKNPTNTTLGTTDLDPHKTLIWPKHLIPTGNSQNISNPVNAVLSPFASGPLVTHNDHRQLQKAGSGAKWEIWEIWNVSQDVHPIHLHHTQFLVLDRWTIQFSGGPPPAAVIPALSGPKRLPDLNEGGWKDTVRAASGELVRLAVRFDDGGDSFHNYTGNYVMHCHLLDHEDMGMMRPLRID
jgi:FtsP/CotA-like multicopper oxidase with cupredoxin domain